MFLPSSYYISQKDVEKCESFHATIDEIENDKCYAGALKSKLIRAVGDYIHNFENYFQTVGDVSGTLSFKIVHYPCETRIEASFDDGMDWPSEDIQKEFMQACKDGDKVKMNTLRLSQIYKETNEK